MSSYLFMALLSAAALLIFLWPWWRNSSDALQRRAANIAAYRSRLQELEQEVASGMLDAAAAQQLREEMGARLLKDTDGPDTPAAQSPGGSLWLAALLVPLLAGAWYYLAGSWRTQNLIALAATNPQAAQQLSVEAMVQRLAQRLQQNPEDAEGWAMLGRSHSVQQKYADAAQDYARANEQSASGNADWLVAEGEALAMSRNRDLQGRPQQLFAAALKLQSDHIRALWLSGMAAIQAGNDAAAIQHWLALAKLPIPDELRVALDEGLAQLAARSGINLEKTAAPDQSPALALQVQASLSPALAAELSDKLDQFTLFIFAKAQDGPPMPLAVQKIQPARLPIEVTLDDSMAMMPTLKLSQFEKWSVTARLTRGGSVQAQSGDYEGTVAVNRADAAKPLALRIDRKIP